MNINRALEILELDQSASISEIKQAYRDLATIWHPDRYSHNPRLEKKSQQKMKDINEAFETLTLYFKYKKQKEASANKSKTDNSEYEIINCPTCGARNRIQQSAEYKFKCGKCGNDLFSTKESNSKNKWDGLLCAVSDCPGIIRDGICSICGRTVEEGQAENERRKSKDQQDGPKSADKNINSKDTQIATIVLGVGIFFFVYIVIAMNSNYHNTQSEPVEQVSREIDPNNIVWDDEQEVDHPAHKTNEHQTFAFDKTSFDHDFIEIYDIKKLQNNLKSIGYNIGVVDGVIGQKTLSACNNFISDFHTISKINNVSELLICANVQANVAHVFPNYLEIIRTNSLEDWLNQKNSQEADVLYSALKSNNHSYITKLISYYYFDVESPKPVSFPATGVHWKSFKIGEAPLMIKTRNQGYHHYIKIIHDRTKKQILIAYLRNGDSIEFDVPFGDYLITYATGNNWYGERFLFGPDTNYGKADKVFEFKKTGNQVFGYTVELFLQPNGNLSTSKLSPFQF